jgi:hypothetical protein
MSQLLQVLLTEILRSKLFSHLQFILIVCYSMYSMLHHSTCPFSGCAHVDVQ